MRGNLLLEATMVVRLYHGSNMQIERPEVGRNTGFSDLGKGFYLTDDLDAARRRALSRARKTGGGAAIVSAFDLDESHVPWITWGKDGLVGDANALREPFGFRFDATVEGVVAWANYIRACRQGSAKVPGWGWPAMVRAWIATEEIEMVCADAVPAELLGEALDAKDLTVQYCLTNQEIADGALRFVGTC